jgi:hypothetical protein
MGHIVNHEARHGLETTPLSTPLRVAYLIKKSNF